MKEYSELSVKGMVREIHEAEEREAARRLEELALKAESKERPNLFELQEEIRKWKLQVHGLIILLIIVAFFVYETGKNAGGEAVCEKVSKLFDDRELREMVISRDAFWQRTLSGTPGADFFVDHNRKGMEDLEKLCDRYGVNWW